MKREPLAGNWEQMTPACDPKQMLQRIYAIAWKDPTQLKAYKKMLVEAKKRDHRVLGQQLNLFSIQVCDVEIVIV